MDKEAEKRQIEYISSQRNSGFSDEVIKKSLLKAGWTEEDVELGFSKVNSQDLFNKDSNLDYENKKTKTTVSQKKESFVKVLGFALMATFVLAGISAVLFYFLYFSETSLDKMSKEEQIVNALLFQEEISSVTTKTDIGLSIEEKLDFGLSVDLYFSNGDKIVDLLMSTIFSADLMFKEKSLTLNMDTEGEMRLIDGVYYVRINKVPEIPFSEDDFSFFEGKWMHLNLLNELSEEELEELEIQFSSTKDSNKKRYKDSIDFLDFIQNSEFLKISELNKEKSNYTYKLEFDIEKLPVLLREIADKSLQETKAEILKEIAIKIEKNWEDFEKIVVMEDGYTIPIIIDIDKETGYLSGFYLDLEFKIATDNEIDPLFAVEEPLNIKFSLKNTFSDFGKEQNIERPENSASLEEVMSDKVLEEGDSSQQKRAKDIFFQSRLGQMRAEAYLYSAETQSYSGVCTNENPGILNLYTEVQERTNGNSECNDSADQWASWVQLVSSDDFWCVDYTGFSGKLTTEPVSGTTECYGTNYEGTSTSFPFDLSSLFISNLKETKENFKISNFQNFFQALVSGVIKTK